MDAVQRALSINRSVNFDCTVTIDQLVNVPLLNGSFKVKWKFLSPITGVQIEAQLKAKHMASTISQRLSHSDEETPSQPSVSARTAPSSPSQSNYRLPSNGSVYNFGGRRSSHLKKHSEPQSHLLTFSAMQNSAPLPPIPTRFERIDSSQSSRKSTHHFSQSPTEGAPRLRFSQDSADDPHRGIPTSPKSVHMDQTLNSRLIELPIKSESSGSTAYVKLKNHAVLFRHAFHCPVSIQINKEGVLQPCTLAVIIKEEHITSQGRREISKHGSVDIDLSQFAPLATIEGAPNRAVQTGGELQRSRIEKAKFLLRDSKTNASLKLQIQMDYISGATVFKTPRALEPRADAVNKSSSYADDTRSINSRRRSGTGSPVSSAVSSDSSQKARLLSNNASGTSKTGTYRPSNLAPEGQDLTLQVADDVINLLFSSNYVPSSGPISQRAHSIRPRSKDKPPKKEEKDIPAVSLTLKPSERNRARSFRSTDSGEEVTNSGRSIRSLRPNFSIFNRSQSSFSAAS